MFKNADKLSNEEKDFLLKVPVYITVMVGGADNKLEEEEMEWAEKVARYRSFKSDPELLQYYIQVDKQFSEQLNAYIEEIKEKNLSPVQRSELISEKLARLNEIFKKLDKTTATKLYNDYKSFARHVASVSDNIFGMGGINPKEWEYVVLPSVKKPSAEK